MLEVVMLKCFFLSTSKPMKESFTQNTEYFNEICLVLVTICMLAMTEDPSLTESSQASIGAIYVTIIAFNICVHGFFLFRSNIKNVKLACRKRQLKKKIR